mmetsp:Transcript_7279/g.29516  ORF Transcript_7279/g.29516 Transcript_7279/m.29516 type:complete len:393 (+) Transcript_7279:32-1210(+)
MLISRPTSSNPIPCSVSRDGAGQVGDVQVVQSRPVGDLQPVLVGQVQHADERHVHADVLGGPREVILGEPAEQLVERVRTRGFIRGADAVVVDVLPERALELLDVNLLRLTRVVHLDLLAPAGCRDQALHGGGRLSRVVKAALAIRVEAKAVVAVKPSSETRVVVVVARAPNVAAATAGDVGRAEVGAKPGDTRVGPERELDQLRGVVAEVRGQQGINRDGRGHQLELLDRRGEGEARLVNLAGILEVVRQLALLALLGLLLAILALAHAAAAPVDPLGGSLETPVAGTRPRHLAAHTGVDDPLEPGAALHVQLLAVDAAVGLTVSRVGVKLVGKVNAVVLKPRAKPASRVVVVVVVVRIVVLRELHALAGREIEEGDAAGPLRGGLRGGGG